MYGIINHLMLKVCYPSIQRNNRLSIFKYPSVSPIPVPDNTDQG